jgi:hypothetical protein
MTTKKTSKIKTILISIFGLSICACLALFLLGFWASSNPGYQATGTSRSQERLTGTAQMISLLTQASLPTSTVTATNTHTVIPSSTATKTNTPTETLDPSFTPPTPTLTVPPTITPSPTRTNTSTQTPTNTATPTNTHTPTKTSTPTNTPTPIPPSAGVSDWILYEGNMIGVREIAWDTYLGYFRAEQGKIYVSLYIVAINNSNSTKAFDESDFSLIDGGGEITHGVIFGRKEPEFGSCQIIPGGACEGWWTTMIWNKPEVKGDLTFRWDPCLIFCDAMEVTIQQ